MNEFQAMFDSLVPAIDKVTVQKEQEVAYKNTDLNQNFYQIALAKGSDVGLKSANPVEQDLRQLNSFELLNKYAAVPNQFYLDGNETALTIGEQAMLSLSEANNQVTQDQLRTRSNTEALYDSTTGVVSGFANSLANLVALGTGLVDEEAGVAVSGAIADANQWLQGTQSDAVNASRKIADNLNSLEERDNEFEYQENVAAGDSELWAGTKQVASDAYDILSNNLSDPTLVAQGTSDALGSLLAGGPVSKGITAVGSAILSESAKRGTVIAAEIGRRTGTVNAARVAEKAADVAPWTLAIGAMESGGVYTGTVNEIEQMPIETLRNSDDFNQYVAQYTKEGLSQDDAEKAARTSVADDAGKFAAARQLPVAMVAGLLTRYAESPFKVESLTKGLMNTFVLEPTEEAIQGGVGQVNQNLAIQEFADSTQSVTEGVGAQVGEGALYGSLSSGAVQAPGVAREVLSAAKVGIVDVASKAGSKITDRINAVQQAAEQDSPLNDEVVAEAAQSIVADAPVNQAAVEDALIESGADEEVANKTRNYFTQIANSFQLDTETELAGLPEELATVVSGSRNRIEAVQKLAKHIDILQDDDSKIQAAGVLEYLMQPINEAKNVDAEVFESIPADHQAMKLLQAYSKLSNSLENTPSVRRASEQFFQLLESSPVERISPEVTEQMLDTPQGIDGVRRAVTIAEKAPDKGNPQAIRGILEHARNGKLVLKPYEFKALQNSLNIIQAKEAYLSEAAVRGLRLESNAVSKNIITDLGDTYNTSPSAALYSKMIIDSVKANDIQTAKAALDDLGLFVQHMQNKLTALNDHYALGDPKAPKLSYMALTPDHTKFVPSTEINSKYGGVFVNSLSTNSISLAQKVELDTQLITSIYNGMVDAFPELNGQKFAELKLNSKISGNPEAIVKAYQESTRKPPVEAPVQSVESEVSNEPASVIEAVVEAPVESETVTEVVTEEPIQETTEPVVEVTPVEEVANETIEEEVTETEEDSVQVDSRESGLKVIYPNLISSVRNFFYEVFQLPKENPISRFTTMEGLPIQTVMNSLSSINVFERTIGTGKSALTKEVAVAYSNILNPDNKGSIFSMVQDAMVGRLNDFLNQPVSSTSSVTRLEVLNQGKNITGWKQGAVLNVTEQDENGVRYNDALLQSAVLAGVQWFISYGQSTSPMSDEDVEEMVGTSIYAVPTEKLNILNNSLGKDEVIQNIANKIIKYWGLQNNPDGDLGYIYGISQAVAYEVLIGLEATGAMKLEYVDIADATGNVKTHVRVVISPEDKITVDNPLGKYRTLLDELALYAPEKVIYMGNDIIPVATNKMNSFGVKNTPEQLDAIKNAQELNEFKLNMHTANFINAVGSNGLIELFGGGIPKDTFNAIDRATIEGKNITIISAFNELSLMMAEMNNRVIAGDAKSIDDLPVKFAMNFSKVERMQMLGSHTPQSSKLVRAALLPTWATIDLTDGKNMDFFLLGLAQATGVKVELASVDASVAKTKGLVESNYRPVLDFFKQWISSNDVSGIPDIAAEGSLDHAELKRLLAEAGIKPSFDALHALMEYAKYELADDVTKFRTSMFIEADGKTNGPINALMLFSAGTFSNGWVNNIAKGGVSLGGPKALHELDPIDLYQTTANSLPSRVYSAVQSMTSQNNGKSFLPNVEATMKLMDLLLPSFNLEVNDLGEWALNVKRDLAKNPLTVTIYGSGVKGIADKVTELLQEAIYQRMTVMSVNKTDNVNLTDAQSMFPESENPDVDYAVFRNAIEILRTDKIYFNKEKSLFGKYSRKDLGQLSWNNPVKFKLDKDDVESISGNLMELIVKPLSTSIWEEMGNSLQKTMDVIGTSTNLHSMIYAAIYQHEVDKAVAVKKETDDQVLYLTQNELTQVRQKIAKFASLVQNQGQQYLVTKSAKDKLDTRFSESLDGRSISAGMYVPVASGVAGKASAVISAGDGRMIQNVAASGFMQNVLYVFDGVNISVDNIEEYSTMLNEASYKAWMVNNLEGIYGSSQRLLNSMSSGYKAEIEAVFIKLNNGLQLEDVMLEFSTLNRQLGALRDTNAARIQVLKEMPVSNDNMASASSPYATVPEYSGTLETNEVVDVMNKRWFELRNKITNPVTEMVNFGRNDSFSGSVIIGVPALWSMLKDSVVGKAFTKEQRSVIIDVLTSKATEGYEIALGNISQLTSYFNKKGVKEVDLGHLAEVNGLTVPDDKIIGIVNQGDQLNAEVISHELVHAATFSKVYAHYQGNSNKLLGEAIGRLEVLMNEFMNMSTESDDAATTEAMKTTQSVITDYLSNLTMAESMRKAGALNEFMAWTLSNQDLITKLKSEKPSTLAGWIAKAVAAIKDILWGVNNKFKVHDSFYGQIRFNSAIVMRASQSLATELGSNALYHRNVNAPDTRLERIRDAMARLMVRADRYFTVNNAGTAVTARAIQIGIDMGNAISTHFRMNPLEKETFQIMVAALSTHMDTNTAALTRIQELYSHIVPLLKPAMFVNPNAADMLSEESLANEKYNVVVGKLYRTSDALGRSTLLSNFLGLAMVNPEFRNILEGIALPKNPKANVNSTDELLEYVGYEFIDTLTKLASSDVKSSNVLGALDAMMDAMSNAVYEHKSVIANLGGKLQSGIDAINDFMVKQLDTLSTAGINATTSAIGNTTNSYAKSLLKITRGLFLLATEDKAKILSQGAIEAINRSGISNTWYELLNDFIGRVDSNGNVYQMIKVVKAAIQQVRQNFKIEVPRIIRKKFTRELTSTEWNQLYQGLGKTDLVSLAQGFDIDTVFNMLADDAVLNQKISILENQIKSVNTRYFPSLQVKMKQLANFMVTSNSATMLLRNSYAIQQVANSLVVGKPYGEAQQVDIDMLVTLYALQAMDTDTKRSIVSLVQTQKDGVTFIYDYMKGQRKTEMDKATQGKARFNHYKGWLPSDIDVTKSLIVDDVTNHAQLKLKGYVYVSDYMGSNVDHLAGHKAYYFAEVSGKPPYSQGIMQNVRNTASGVDESTGFSSGIVAGRIINPAAVARILRSVQNESINPSTNHLLPVFNEDGEVVAFERPIKQTKIDYHMQPANELDKIIGVWRGRQVEEHKAGLFNKVLISRLHNMWTNDLANNVQALDGYVNLLAPTTDKVVEYAVNLFTPQTKAYIAELFPEGEFWVRKDLMNDVLGYPNASVADYWSGINRMNPEVEKVFKDFLMFVFKDKAFATSIKIEKFIMSVASTIRTNIVIRSVLVPVMNFLSSVFQLVGRGVPILSIGKGLGTKLVEIRQYTASKLEQVEIEAELRAVHNDPRKELNLKNRLRSIVDSHKRMSIWPLIQAGEFSTVADVGLSKEDLEISSGNFTAYMEGKINQLPGPLKTAARYGFITRDTALFEGLQKSVQYTDFIAKAILFDDLTKRKGMTEEAALAVVVEEYVNHDRLSGRVRGGLENLGLLWFYNFKIRIAKIAFNMARTNPFQTLLLSIAPLPAGVGVPSTDNLISKVMDGTALNSVGPEMAYNSLSLNPWVNIVD